ncbi:bifunctional riboflavin kinase/FMN phosphatase-like [Punica granatum]|uniref:Bifunctional riboflavin kinase/FMN phosphatase-like n=2 Tax=Punica granatum TaxID=22663 RepID=A0A6P8C6L7_PUNGR|nr:bifunctional riboflavin kinase/FMN phosphatase-like [Punica granatum]XP_031379173.1 bifunctional riboflavin kinase/FMN phosphatase-like [Punica granatum]PKI42765.1 hypothetical protein CRG98_036893 [Punica granatum]
MSCCACKRRNAISAVILDLDGTLVDTENGSKGVLKEFLAKHGRVLNEGNKRLGKTLKESAISIVEDYDLPLTPDQFIQEITPMYREKWLQAKPLPGSNRLIKHLHKHGVPFALASNSLRDYIDAKIANQDGWKESFSAIIGSDDVESGKPSPDIFIEAARRMGVDAAQCLVIEDSLVGVKGAKAANMKVMAVPSHEEADSSSMADAVINTLLEFQPEIWGLPPFDDWVQNALPIERIYLSCRNISGFLHEMKEDGKFGLTNQTSGIFFGWAQVSLPKTFKAVVAIGFHSPNNTRKLQLSLIDDCRENAHDQHLQLSLVGFIRGLKSKEELTSKEMVINEEDKSIASESLDLPIFMHGPCMPFAEEKEADLNDNGL